MRSESTISVVAWDLDNTLIDRDTAFRSCLQALAHMHGGILDSQGMQRVLAYDRSGKADRLATMALLASQLGLPITAAPELWDETKRLLPDFITPEPEIIRLLSGLAGQYSLVLVSNGDGPLQRAKLRRSGLLDFFRERWILISGELGMKKPEPEIFSELTTRTEQAPTNIMFVGDDPVNDMAGAAAANMMTCWVSRGESWPSGPLPDMVVMSALELDTVLARRETVSS
ncbi:hypothetical protein BH09VER1_BH09VER1_45380 [soil metagenome]